MAELAILVPVLRRPHRVAPLLRAIGQTTPTARTVFLTDPDDIAERGEIARWGRHAGHIDDIPCGGGYAAKIACGVEKTTEPLLLLAADDLAPQPGWLTKATAYLRDGYEVVGLNDGLERKRRPEHATHFLITRSYAERPTIDGGKGPLCDLYDHSFVDDEMIGTATKRGVYVYAHDAVVKHLHWINGLAEDDAIYRKGRRRYRQDRMLFRQRRHLWES